MACNYFISDLHLAHRNILKFSPNRLGHSVDSVEDHDSIILSRIFCTMTKRDILYILGDVAFSEDKLELLDQIPGRKVLIMRRHNAIHSLEISIQSLLNRYKE